MLKQIIQARCVDPELLKLLSEEQKELLFRKIRQEQLRIWTEREKEYDEKDKGSHPASKKPKIGFHNGKDGNPWVWVCGEYPGDLSYEELIAKRELEKREKERENTRQAALKVAHMMNSDEGVSTSIESESQDRAVDSEARQKLKGLWKKALDNTELLVEKMTPSERAAYQSRRADEIYEKMLHTQEISKKRAADAIMDCIIQWRQSEEKAKSYEEQQKKAYLKAREMDQAHVEEDVILASMSEEKKKLFVDKMGQIKAASRLKQSKSTSVKDMMKFFSKQKVKDTAQHRWDKAEMEKWFREVEIPKGTGMESDGTISLWFHGLIRKPEAEERLRSEPVGCFLIRISEKGSSYTASVRTPSGVSHFVISVSHRTGCYSFIGRGHREFARIDQLLEHYRVTPITAGGKEFLIFPCEQTEAGVEAIKLLYHSDDEESDFTVC